MPITSVVPLTTPVKALVNKGIMHPLQGQEVYIKEVEPTRFGLALTPDGPVAGHLIHKVVAAQIPEGADDREFDRALKAVKARIGF